MRIVIDTNAFLVMIGSKSRYHWFFEDLLAGKFEVLLNNEILAEYEEIISQKANVSIAIEVLDMLITLPNTVETLIYYRWQLIQEDEDDNKFADTAIAGQADYLIIHDNHFKLLKAIDFPKVQVVSLDEFKEIIKP